MDSKVNISTLVALLLLVIQNTASVTLQHNIQSRGDNKFNPLAAIVLSELLKLTVSILYLIHSTISSPSTKSLLTTLRHGHEEAAVPALLYTAATFAQSIGASYLDLLPYLALCQLKIITTPILATLLLYQKFTPHHWLFLCMMTAGIILAQTGTAADRSTVTQPNSKHPLPGLTAMLFAGFCVAFGSIAMEKSLKRTNCFFVRNAQLAAHSLLFALLSFLWSSRFDLSRFFDGFDALVWVLVVLLASGGFLVAWCVQLTSTVTKNYAQGLGFALAVVMPLAMSHARINHQLFVGVVLVLGAVLGSVLVGSSTRPEK